MFKLKPALTMKLIKQGWVTYPMYRGNKFIIENPDDTDERYTFSSNNQILWFLRGFESGLKKTEETVEETEELPDVSDLLSKVDEERKTLNKQKETTINE